MNYLSAVATRETPQIEPILGENQSQNNAGGFVYTIDKWQRLTRFLVLGSEGGTYYVKEKTLTLDNAKNVLECIKADGERAVSMIREISLSGRAPKNDPAIFALAMAASLGNSNTKKAAFDALPDVCRTSYHLFRFAQCVQGFRGWGRSLRNGIANWYFAKTPSQLAYQAVKYQQRDGWSHRDLLRLSHPRPSNDQYKTIFNWIVKGWESVGEEPHLDQALQIIWAFERAKQVKTMKEVVNLICDYGLPHEAIPTEWKKEKAVWEALLENIPMTAMIRNLATMTVVGLLTPGSNAVQKVVAELNNIERIKKARVHPINVLAALKVYAQGHGERGHNTWNPVTQVINALDGAFYSSFGNIEPTNQRYLLGIDVSGSMDWNDIAGMPGITPRVGAAAMSLVTAATEPNHTMMAFSHQFVPLNISPRQRLDDVIKVIDKVAMGATDCALPMVWALQNKIPVDVFVTYTDSETFFGGIHPVQALRQYREKMGIPAKMVVVGMTATEFSIADNNDPGSLDVVGFDAATPQLINDFARGLV